MRHIMIIVAAVVFWTVGTVAPRAQTDTPAIRDVIQNQFDAFQDDDFAKAFDYASPMIKGIFGSPERFGAMVQGGYPMVYRPAEVRFLDLHEKGGALWQKVVIKDAAGVLHVLDYQMIETENGWQINGVELLQTDPLGV